MKIRKLTSCHLFGQFPGYFEFMFLTQVVVFSGRIVMGLFGKTVPLTAGNLTNNPPFKFEPHFINMSVYFMLLHLDLCFFFFLFSGCAENFRALCTGS